MDTIKSLPPHPLEGEQELARWRLLAMFEGLALIILVVFMVMQSRFCWSLMDRDAERSASSNGPQMTRINSDEGE